MLETTITEDKLGVSDVKEILYNFCVSEKGKEKVNELGFSSEYNQLQSEFGLLNEALTIVDQEGVIPVGQYVDNSELLGKLSIGGFYLSEEELFDFRTFFNVAAQCINFFTKADIELPYFQDRLDLVYVNVSLQNKIERTIDERGKIKSNASKELSQIREKLRKEESRLRSTLDRVLREVKKKNFTREDALITVRGGRLVIPVLSENKRKLNGLIHDESATGLTAFVEPGEVIEINNQVIELKHKEHREIVRILTDITLDLADEKEEIEKLNDFLSYLDFINAKCKYAALTHSIVPDLENKPSLSWVGAYHPVLFLKLKENAKSVVPLNIILDEDEKLLLLSGPNAGGKSIALKTVGIIQYLTQCGLPVPVSEGTKIGLYQNILLDIGDDQSIESNLSTYSAHLTKMNEFLHAGNQKSLVLIDEFGTGTEPQFGAAFAEAILEELLKINCFGVITTHYTNLKTLAQNRSGIINGAMLFDKDSLSPLYRLKVGLAGSSYAFELAKKIGFKNSILEKATSILGDEHVELDEVLSKMENENHKLQDELKVVSKEKEKLQKSYQEFEELSKHLKSRKENILEDARREAERIIKAANKEIEKTIRTIKETEADKIKTQEARQDLAKYAEKNTKKLKPKATSASANVILQVGDIVKIDDGETKGEIVKIKGNEATIVAGSIKSNVKLKRLVKVGNVKGNTPLKTSAQTMNFKQVDFSPKIDVRGKRANEVLQEVDSLIDKALLYGYGEVVILHGKGDGILRNIIRNYLKDYSQVESVKDEDVERGGSGISIVTLQ